LISQLTKFLEKNFATIISGILLASITAGYFYERDIYDSLHIALIFLLIVGLAGSFYFLFIRNDEEQKSGVILLIVSGVNVLVHQFKNDFNDIYILNYIVSAFSCAVSGLKAGLFTTFIIFVLDISFWMHNPGMETLKTPLLNLAVNTLFVTIVGLYLFAESHQKNIIKEKYENIIKEAESLEKPVPQDFNVGDLKMLSRDQRQKRMLRISMELDDKIHKIMEVIKQSLHPFSCVLFMKNSGSSEFMIKDIISDTEEINTENIDFNEGVLGWVLHKKTPIYLSEFKGIHDIPYYKFDQGIKSFLAVPVVRQSSQAVDAIICVDSVEVQAFNEEHKKIISILGNQIMESIEHAEIINQMVSEMTEFAAFYEVSRKLASTLNLSDILFTTLDSARKIVKYSFGAIIFNKSEQNILEIKSFVGKDKDDLIHQHFNLEDSLVGYLIKNYNRTYLIGDASQKASVLPIFGQKLKSPFFASLLFVPLQIKNTNIGAMLFASETPYFFTSYEAEILEVLGNQVSVAIDNSRMYEQVEAMAVTDGLTQLYNHRKFQEILEAEFKRAQRYNTPLSIMLLDVDRFKNINDTRGHPVGDEVLKKIAGLIKRFIRDTDYPCRYGGEEFVIVLPNTGTKEAVIIAERIRKSVEKSTFILNSREELYITISIGIATYPSDAGEKHELVDKADKALYYAKESGRNQTQSYEGLKNLKVV